MSKDLFKDIQLVHCTGGYGVKIEKYPYSPIGTTVIKWDGLIRPKEKISQILQNAKTIADSKKVSYGLGSHLLFDHIAAGKSISNLPSLTSDCSAFIASVIRSVGGMGISSVIATGSMLSSYPKEYFYIKYADYAGDPANWQPGDILVAQAGSISGSTYGHAAMVYGEGGTVPKKNIEKAWAFFQQKGVCQKGCAAMCAHLFEETGSTSGGTSISGDIRPSLNEKANGKNYTDIANQGGSVNDFYVAGTGYGILQWTNDRRKTFFNYWKANYYPQGISIADLDMQLNYLWYELENKIGCLHGFSQTKLLSMKDSDDLLTLVDTIHEGFVRSDDKNRGIYHEREKTAQLLYAQYEKIKFSYDGTGTYSKEYTIKDYLSLWGQSFLKYSTKNSIPTCLMTENGYYASAQNLKPQGIVICTYTMEDTPYLSRYIWPSQSDNNYSDIASKLGTYHQNHWNFKGYEEPCMHIAIGYTGNNQIAAFQTMPFDKQVYYYKEEEIRQNYLHVFFCYHYDEKNQYWSSAYKELVEVIAYLCCLYQINPDEGQCIKDTNYPTIALYQDITGKTTDIDKFAIASAMTTTKLRKDIVSLIMGNENEWQHTTTDLTSTQLGEFLKMDPNKQEDCNVFIGFLDEYLETIAGYDPGHWSAAARLYCEDNGIILGYNDVDVLDNLKYKYKQFITRQELVAMLDRFIPANNK